MNFFLQSQENLEESNIVQDQTKSQIDEPPESFQKETSQIEDEERIQEIGDGKDDDLLDETVVSPGIAELEIEIDNLDTSKYEQDDNTLDDDDFVKSRSISELPKSRLNNEKPNKSYSANPDRALSQFSLKSRSNNYKVYNKNKKL